MASLDNKKIISTICKTAHEYDTYFAGKNIVFIYGKKEYNYIKTIFRKENFLHLTGLETSLSPKQFYNKCMKNTLSIKDFKFHKNGTTELKMKALPQLLNIHSCYKMIGLYSENKAYLATDALAGNTICCLGFKENNDFYIPNTSLYQDIRNCTYKAYPIVAVLYKAICDTEYNNFYYKSKSFSETDLNVILNEIMSNENLENVVIKKTHSFSPIEF